MPAQRKSKNHDDGESDHETIDINVSDTSSSDGDQASVSPVTAIPENQSVPATLAPLLPSAPTGRTNTAHDINYFFDRGSRTDGSLTICKQCRQVYNLD